ncbi:MAG TPA: hypothetical protein VFS44_09815 [Gemmatimonadaceae bacterium]|nr:hypothetical protein [Gemmatimonadaceae bacterium]
MRLISTLALALLCAAALARPARAQGDQLTYPNLRWRTIETRHFTIHYPARAEAWTRDVASRIESVYGEVTALVGHAPGRRVTIIVEDPNSMSNGFAIPLLDEPLIFFWPTPPDPTTGVGDNRGWGEMLAVHEFAHVAQLTRPSRNPLQRLLARIAPAKLGPLALKSPRWLIEGYATYVEGKLTGMGRPHSAWRAAVLREWARDGKLPTYGQLDRDPRFEGGSMAYLAGSAYLEWLVERSGDSSLVHLWRRMSARRNRSFDAAFAGVFGGYPQDLYGRFTAELTGKALEVERGIGAALGASAADSGAGRVVQSLQWRTGSPAVSRDGRLVALTLSPRDEPTRVVVWRTEESPRDSIAAARARARDLQLDPEDVPAVHWRPTPRTPVATLYPRGGAAFTEPRFLPDGHRLLVIRYTGRGDGAVRPDLFEWDMRTGDVRRITHDAAVQHADPSPDGRWAAADRCVGGICDLVRVDLATGRLTTLAHGAPHVVYHRPRVSPDGRTIAVSVQSGGRWRVALVDAEAPADPRFVGPDDGANRYEPAFLAGGREVALVSDATGIPNIEVMELATGATRTLTLVTGAATAPEPDSARGAIYYLRLHATGLDLSAVPDSVRRPATFATSPALAPAARVPAAPAPALATAQFAPPRAYGIGPRTYRVLPSLSWGAEGKTFGLMLSGLDPVGRLTWLAQGMYGDRGTWRGGSLGAAWRGSRPIVAAEGFYTEDHPSEQHGGLAAPPSLDVDYAGGALRLELPLDLLTNAHRLWIGGSAGRLDGPARDRATRAIAFAGWRGAFEQTARTWRLVETLGLSGAAGRTAGAGWSRGMATASLSVHSPRLAITAEGGWGRVTSDADPFEQFAIGGSRPPLFDAALLEQRIAMPALPVGVAGGRSAAFFRIALPRSPLTPYYWGGSAGGTLREWHRVVGLEGAFRTDGLWPVRVPGVRAVLGVGYSLDRPLRHETRAYASVTYRP